MSWLANLIDFFFPDIRLRRRKLELEVKLLETQHDQTASEQCQSLTHLMQGVEIDSLRKRNQELLDRESQLTKALDQVSDWLERLAVSCVGPRDPFLDNLSQILLERSKEIQAEVRKILNP